MKSPVPFVRIPSAGIPSHRRCRRLALALLLAVLAAGCSRPQTSTGIAPRLTPTSDTLGIRSTMAPVRAIPIAVASAAASKPFRLRHSYDVTPGRASALLLVNGRALGRRRDGTIDHVAAGQSLRMVDPRSIVSIQIVKGDEALGRYGPAARGGAVLIVTSSDTSHARNRVP